MLLSNNSEASNVISKLSQHFLRGSLKFSLNSEEIKNLIPDVQEAFLRETIYLKRVKEYPLNNDFCRIFFKKLISLLEQNQEIHDEIYLFLCSQMKKTSEGNEFSYRHYVFKNTNNIVTIKETKNMVIHGTTGMKTWEAAFMLADWALCNKDVINHKKILELGSGVGFTGVSIAMHCNIPSVILTDCHEEVLTMIKDNIRINFPDLHEEEKEEDNITFFTDQHKSLGIRKLDWNFVDSISDDIAPDILIGADIVYDPSIISALCNIILAFFRKNSKLEVYIASIVRNQKTFKTFLESLDESGLIYEEILQLQPVYIDWDSEMERKFLKIKLN